jgi:predicted thioesterase
MKDSMQIGNETFHSFVVVEEMQPQFDGTVIHPVCSTWDLAHQFEITARKALVPHLVEGEEGIGSKLNIHHCSPAPLGSDIAVTATVVELDETTVVCSLEAKKGETVVATGTQTQRVFPKNTVDAIIANASD